MIDREAALLMDALEMAWVLIANAGRDIRAGEGRNGWDCESEEWVSAATRWRDEYWHPALSRAPEAPSGRPTRSDS